MRLTVNRSMTKYSFVEDDKYTRIPPVWPIGEKRSQSQQAHRDELF